MATQLAFDKLAYIDKLKASGIDDAQARAHADALDQALREEIATKRDIAELRHEIQVAVRDIIIRVGSMIFVGVGILIAIKYFG